MIYRKKTVVSEHLKELNLCKVIAAATSAVIFQFFFFLGVRSMYDVVLPCGVTLLHCSYFDILFKATLAAKLVLFQQKITVTVYSQKWSWKFTSDPRHWLVTRKNNRQSAKIEYPDVLNLFFNNSW